ncbi:MAG: TonB-dependent receptor plug domain-containing protein [candidate division Zixibacteria bacterium]|nr:TonB-dependent receptor plug domain-containing protein [candidate division Zixibacteria bacterium]
MRKNATPSLREMDGRQILEIPGANQDLLRSLTYLPGINTRSDYSSQLYVRGGGPEQNLILIDGITVSSPYRLGTFVSAFNPDLVEGIELLPGGFPAQYGNRLSSVLDIKYRTSEREGYSLISNTSLINTSSVFEGPLINQDGGFVLSVRRTYYDLILNQVTEDDVAFPYFYDVQGKIDYDFSEKFRGEVHLETATGGFKLKTDRDDDEDALNLDLRDKNSDGLLAFTLGYSPSDRFDVRTQISRVHRNEDFRIDGDLKLDVDVSGDRYSLKQDAIYQQEEDKYRLLFGWEYQNTNAHFGWTLTADDSLKQDAPPGDQNPFMPKQDSFGYEGGDIFTGGYTSFEYRDWEKFRPTIGFRYDWSDVVDKYKLSPRLALNYRINTQDMIKLAWGYYYQFPSYEILSEKGYFPETWRNSELDAEKAVHYLIGWEHIYDLDWKLRLDFYYKRLSDLVVDYDTTLIPVNNGRGDSEGFELYLEKRKTKNSRYSGWISYTLAKSWSETPWSSYYFISDQLHTLNIVSDIKFTDRISAGLTWRFGSGMPYTPVIGVEEISVTDSITGQPVVVDWEPIYGATNSVRFPAYHRLDVRINFAFKWYSLPCTAYIEAINTYNQKNVYSYNWDRRYSERETTHELPFIPSFGLIIKFF